MDRLDRMKKPHKEMHATMLTAEIEKGLLREYDKAERRLLLLDYDGTLVPFFGKPEEARPGNDLLQLLKVLVFDAKNEVVILSGRDKDTLDQWFQHLGLGLVAEHGVWLKQRQWEIIEPLTNEWKKEIRPILEPYTEQTPGSFIEEKEFSLVWHYRKSDPELGIMRVRELIDELSNLTANLNLQILEGSKVVEVKNSAINKGRAASRLIKKRQHDFILAVGDDRTDEDTFDVLPEYAYSFKVGLSSSLARFNLKSQEDVLLLLKELVSARAK